MSNLVFPLTLPGMKIDVGREPIPQVKVQETQSGKEIRYTWETYPRIQYTVSFEILRADSAISLRTREFQQVFGHFCRTFGQLDSFLISDPEDSSVTDMGFAVGDGVTTTFQFQKSLLGAVVDAAGFQYNAYAKPYTNLLKNSSFDTDTSGGSIADTWAIYNNESATVNAFTVTLPGRSPGTLAQRISWGVNATNTKGLTTSPTAFGWADGKWYTISVFARATGTNVGKFIALNWNAPSPNQTLVVSCPALTTLWQRYVFQVFWNAGTNPSGLSLWFTINDTNAGTYSGITNCFGDLDFDDAQVVVGQFGAADLQPISTPVAATATRNPALWPKYTDGFEPISDLNGDVTIYQDGDWQGRQQLYPFIRFNRLLWTEQFDQATWTKSNVTVTANAVTAPDGNLTADQIVETATATVEHYVEQISGGAAGSLQSISVYAKANQRSWLRVSMVQRDGVTIVGASFNVSTGAVGTVDAGVTAFTPQYMGNGWYRLVITVAVTAGASNPRIRYKMMTADNQTNYTGDGASSMYIWGAQQDFVFSTTLGARRYTSNAGTVNFSVLDYTINASGQIVFPAAPAAGAFFSFDGKYYKRVRFADTGLLGERFGQSMWEIKTLKLITVKP